MKVRKIFKNIRKKWIINLSFFSSKLYMKKYKKFLLKNGMNILGTGPAWIAHDVWFDSTDYQLISLDEGCLISRQVVFLTHDYSAVTILRGKNNELTGGVIENNDMALQKKPIFIGKNTFIGVRATILLGTHIGNNCIIGAGCVVKGNIPDDSIVIGNPARIIKNTNDWIQKFVNYKGEDANG